MHRHLVVLTAAVIVSVAPASAQTPAEFYKGKQVTFYVGLSPGGGYDLNARLVARHIGRHIPGQPQVIVKNMPGGGGLSMTNFVANVSAKDGLSIGAPQLSALKPDAIIMHPLPRGREIDPDVDQDPRAMYWRQERNGMWMRVAVLIKIFAAEDRIAAIG